AARIQNQLLAKNRRIRTEPLCPEFMRNNHHRRQGRVAFFFWTKVPAQRGFHIQKPEIFCAYDFTTNQYALFSATVREACRCEDCESIKRVVLFLPVTIIRVGRPSSFNRCALYVSPKQNQPFGVRIWQRPQEDCIHDTEDRNSSSNAQCEDENNGDGKGQV